jgi:hypothetical protein
MAVTITTSPVTAFNTIIAGTENLATADTDALAEVFTYTPTASGGKILIEFDLSNKAAVAAADADATFSIAAGDFWAGKAITGTITKATKKAIQVETANVLQDDGTIAITLTPGANDKLLSNHAANIVIYELL